MATRSATKRSSIVLMFFLFVSINILGQKANAQDLYVYFDEHGGKYRLKKDTISNTIVFYFILDGFNYCFENNSKKEKKRLVSVDDIAKIKFMDPIDVFKEYRRFWIGHFTITDDKKKVLNKKVNDNDFNPIYIIEYEKKNKLFYKSRVFYMVPPILQEGDIYCE